MRWLRNVWHLGRKEIASLARDTVLFLFLVYSFTFTVYSEATGIDIEVRDASIAIVDGDHSTLSRSISAALRPPWFRPPVLIDRADLDQAMDSGRFSFALEIPPGFEADLLRGLRPELRLDVDATAMSQAGIGDSYIQRIVLDEVLAFLKSRGIEAD
ncbi:MAG: ABC transporter permease, partial [Rhodobacter sp.]|nr:ABC transporter permease [Rhodobacter sp.]